MKQKPIHYFILSVFAFLILIACNNADKKAEVATSKDSVVATTATNAGIDALTASPSLYKLISDTLGIRVVEATYNPGDSSSMHSHPDNAIYVIQGGKAEFTLKDGSKVSNELKSGTSAVRGAEMHSVKNTGNTTMKVLLVELNRPSTIVAPDATNDANNVSKDHYKVLNDSLGIRIVEVSYKPGEASGMHSHPDAAAYVIEGGTGELTDKEGKKNTTDMKTGMAWVMASTTHSGKNTGKTNFKLLLFEVNRARN